MYCRKYLKTQKIHHKALKVVYNSSRNYEELLRDSNKISGYQNTCFNKFSKQSKSQVYVVVLCFQKLNVQYKIRFSAEITYCKIDFLRYNRLPKVYFGKPFPNLLNTVNLFLN